MTNKPFWQADWFPGLIIPLIFLLSGGASLITSLEYQGYAAGSRLAPSPGIPSDIKLIEIDETSLNELGPWPWPRSHIAKVIQTLSDNDVRVVGVTIPLHTTQSNYSVSTLDVLHDEYENKNKKTEKAVKQSLFKARQKLDTDGALTNSLKNTKRTVLAITHGEQNSLITILPATPLQVLKPFSLNNFSVDKPSWFHIIPGPLTNGLSGMLKPLPPIEMLSKYSSAGLIGGSNTGSSSNPAVPLIMKHNDHYYPSFSLVYASRSLGVDREGITYENGIKLDGKKINTDSGLHVYPRFYSDSNESPAFNSYSFKDIYNKEIDTSIFKGKDVLIGITAPSLVNTIITPNGINMPPLTAAAHVISNILQNHLYKVPGWALLAQLTVYTLIAFYLMWLLPRFKLWTGFVTSLLLLFLVINTQLLLMIISATWIPLITPALALFTGSIIVAIRTSVHEKHQITKSALHESNQVLGKNLQSQGQLDQAFEKYRLCTMDDSLAEQMYSLGLDYERKRQFNKAEMVFKYIRDYKTNFKDIKDRIKRNREMQNMVVLPKKGSPTQSTIILPDNGIQKPVLGRYEIEKEIGRGAMGLVYLGKDPKIGRTVAIKTMSLSDEFSGHELEAVKARFFREAEAAGRLNHPNIVTIYDAGEEQELAYIAMDYLKGDDLAHHDRPDTLLPLETVLKVIADVATALDYAHKMNVVHRDVKPANIIYDDETGLTKVTDFGVACLTDASNTKTGTMLGSPSYMSPEQVCAKKVDGRSDIFSLGVTLYRLATGKLPFESDTIAALTHKITNEKHPSIKQFLPDAPGCINTIINKALQKDPEQRYQTGDEMAKAIKSCLNKLTE